ncbi:MAG: cysteine--tRNA ligase [Stellaceae bacterium]
MPLTLYNTLSRRKEIFTPLDAKNVRLYVCGPTVYDLAHIGNARPVIVFDVLYRLLRAEYGAAHVTYVRNITDVDDKINAAAKENGESIRELTTRTAEAFHADVAALNCLPPDAEPRATEHIAPMIAMIEKLIASSHAYEAEGHVLFSVPSKKDYGKLSRRDRDDMIAGARVEVAPYKRDPADFVLWKPSPPDLPGWDSPWGRGRPGWHIECSAMSGEFLGESFDIHGGGLDLIFPHHENEIAQSECAHPGKPFVKYWLHNGFVTVEGEKMAKSAGNFRTIRDVLVEVGGPFYGEVIRFATLKTHYRQPLDWTNEGLREAKAKLDRWYRLLEIRQGILQPHQKVADKVNPASVALNVKVALEDDLNTPEVLSAVDTIVDEAFRAQRAGDIAELRHLTDELLETGKLLGLLQQDPEVWSKRGRVFEAGITESASATDKFTDTVTNPRIDGLVQKRLDARKAKDFALADKIRADLAAEGVILEDKPDGTTKWRRG